MVLDERGNYLVDTGSKHPIIIEDFSTLAADTAREARDKPNTLHVIVDSPIQADEVTVDSPTVVSKQIGAVAFLLGPKWRVLDFYSITDPVGARFQLEERLRPGHEKFLTEAWRPARLRTAPSTPAGAAATEATRCGPLKVLLDGITQPLTPETYLNNLVHAPSATFLRYPSNPEKA